MVSEVSMNLWITVFGNSAMFEFWRVLMNCESFLKHCGPPNNISQLLKSNFQNTVSRPTTNSRLITSDSISMFAFRFQWVSSVKPTNGFSLLDRRAPNKYGWWVVIAAKLAFWFQRNSLLWSVCMLHMESKKAFQSWIIFWNARPSVVDQLSSSLNLTKD